MATRVRRRSTPVHHRGATTAVAIVLAAAVVLAGCRSAQRSPTASPPVLKPQRGGTLSYGIESDPSGLDPSRNAWDQAGLTIANAIFETLGAFDEQGIAQPYLAESFEHSDDYKTWTIKLRPNITFSDGKTPLNADTMGPNGGWYQYVTTSPVTGQAAVYFDVFEKVNDLEFRIKMTKPWASFPAILTGQGGYVAAPQQYASADGQTNPIGVGPFKLQSWAIGERLTVVRNERYWRKDADGQPLPLLDRISFDVVPEDTERFRRLQDGSLDVVRGTTFQEIRQLDELAATGAIKIDRGQTGSSKTLLMFNTAKAPLDDVRVRKGLAHATDVNALAAARGWPSDRLADSPFEPTSPWYEKVDQPRFDLAEAERLFSEYRRATGKPVRFTLSGAYEPGLLQDLADQWRAAGAEVDIATVDFKKYVILAVAGDFEVMLFRYFGYTDPDTLWHFWSSETADGPIALNFTRLPDAEIDRGIDVGRASPNPSERKAGYARMQQRFGELVPYVWLYHEGVVVARRPHVHSVRNETLPDGTAAAPYDDGVHRLVETWIDGA